jgi:hypothetical protein
MAVPQLQLANLGEIYAQNQAKQAAMDTMQLEQAAAVEKMRQDQLARQKQAQLLEMAKTVDISTPEGAKQAFQAGLLDVDKLMDVQKGASDIKLAETRGEAAQRTADASMMRAKNAERQTDAQIAKWRRDSNLNGQKTAIAWQQMRSTLSQQQIEMGANVSRALAGISDPKKRQSAYTQSLPILRQAFPDFEMPENVDDPSLTAAMAVMGGMGKPQSKGGGTVTLPDGTVIESGGFSNEQKLRLEFLNQSKNFIDVRDSFARLQAVSADPSPAGDISMIFSYMKMLDPVSVVREGEQATAQNAAGVPDRIRNWYNKILTGEKLSPDQRADFVRQGQKLYDQAFGQTKQNVKIYKEIAQKSGLNPELAVPDIGIVSQLDPTNGGQGGGLLKPSGQSAEGKPTFTYGY